MASPSGTLLDMTRRDETQGRKGKKGQDKPEDEDRARPPALGLRFPAPLVEAMRELARRNRRPLTTEISIALEKHLKEHGLWPPASTEDE